MTATKSTDFEHQAPPKLIYDRNPISIALMFYLLTMAAIVAACLRRLSGDDQVTTGSLMAAISASSLVGLLIGFVGGSFYFKSVKAALIGFCVGAILGAIVGPLVLIREIHYTSMMNIAFVGSWLLVVAMLLAARFQVRTRR